MCSHNCSARRQSILNTDIHSNHMFAMAELIGTIKRAYAFTGSDKARTLHNTGYISPQSGNPSGMSGYAKHCIIFTAAVSGVILGPASTPAQHITQNENYGTPTCMCWLVHVVWICERHCWVCKHINRPGSCDHHTGVDQHASHDARHDAGCDGSLVRV